MDKSYTIIEVASKLNLSDKTLRRWEEAGRFTPSRTLGNQRRYSLEDLQILDAIKHGTINDQKELLTADQAAKLCGVSVATIARWEDSGKIHPFITAGNTYYPRTRLLEKLDELRQVPIEKEPERVIETWTPHEEPVKVTTQPSPRLNPLPQVSTKVAPKLTQPSVDLSKLTNSSFWLNILVTLILILSYHLLVNAASPKPISPQSGSVQGASTINDPTLDMLRTILDPTGALTTTTINSRLSISSPLLTLPPSSAPSTPTPGTLYYDAVSQSLKVFKGTGWADVGTAQNLKVDGATFVSGSAILAKGQNQVSVTSDKITATSLVTATFTSDYAPAKKYWLTQAEGSFTLHTDFPVSADSPFNYLLLENQVASPSAQAR